MRAVLLSIVLFLIGTNLLLADHVLGSQIDYKSLGGKKYLITLTAYRDCNSLQISAGQLKATCSAGTQNFNLTLKSITDITGINNSCGVSSRCSGSFSYGFEKLVFESTIDLSSLSCCEVILSWEQCCRSTLITTGASASNYYTQATINTCTASSLAWNQIDPVFLLTTGIEQMFNFSAYDATDGDSISYAIILPQSAQGTDVGYSGQFAASKPITFLGFPNPNLNSPAGFHFDEQRGNISFRPTKQNEVTSITVEATEWRTISGTATIIGKTRKELTLFVVGTNTLGSNKPPMQKSPDTFAACAGDTSVAVIDIIEQDAADVLTFTFQHNLKWASAERMGGATGRKILVRYLADSIPADGILNAFTIEVKDNACPVLGRNVKTYGIVKGGASFTDASYITKTSGCGKASFTVNNRLAGNNFSYTWNIYGKNVSLDKTADNVQLQLSDTGWVKADLWVTSPQHCNFYKYTDSIHISDLEAVKVYAGTDTTVCGSAPVAVKALPVFGQSPYTYKWSNGATKDTTTIYPPKKSSSYIVTMTDGKGCTASDTLEIFNLHPLIGLSGSHKVCKNTIVSLTAAIADTTNSVFGWDGGAAGVLELKDTITANTIHTFRITEGICTFSKSHEVFVSIPTLTYNHDTVYCVGDTMRLEAIPSGGVLPYSIYWGTYAKPGQKVAISTYNAAPGYTYFSTTVTDSLGCTEAINGKAWLNASPVITINTVAPVCTSGSVVNLSVNPLGGTWSGNGVSNSIFNPSTAGRGLHYLKYNYTEPATGCTNTANTFIRVINPPTVDFTADSTSVIKGSTLQFTNQSTADTGFTNKWVFGLPETPANTRITTDAKFTFNDTGYFTVKLIINDGVCAPDSVIKTNYIRVYQPAQPPTGIIYSTTQNLNVFPNPASNELQLELPKGETIMTLTLTDGIGREVKDVMAASDKVLLPQLSKGVYTLHVLTNNQKLYTTRVLIE